MLNRMSIKYLTLENYLPQTINLGAESILEIENAQRYCTEYCGFKPHVDITYIHL